MDAQDAYYATDVGYDANSVNQPPADPFAGLDETQRAQLEEELRQELAKTEEEIATLKQVLASKTKAAQEIKRKLGISAWKEWTSDLGQGVKNLQETTAYKDVSTKITQLNTAIHSAPILGGVSSTLGEYTGPVYQKTSEALSGVTEKTSSLFGGIGGSLAKRLGDVKSAGVFKSFEATVGNVKSKMTGSRSNSTNSFEEALNSMEQQRQQQAGGVPPTIPEANGSS